LKTFAGWVLNIILASCIGIIFGFIGFGAGGFFSLIGFAIGFATYFVAIGFAALVILKIFEWLDQR
jgi:hypothetical protein